jgi:type IV pilus assembly protein PilB
VFEGHDGALFDLLAACGRIGIGQLEQAREECRSTGRALADVLLDLGLIEKSSLLGAVATHFAADQVESLPAVLPGEILALVDPGLAHGYGVVPLCAAPGTITLLTANPFNRDASADLTFALARRVRFAVADPAEVAALVRRCYGEETPVPREPAVASLASLPAPTGSGTDLEQLAGEGPVIRFVNLVLARAIRDGASDIHFEPFEREFRIRCRVDGLLRELPPPPAQLARPVVSRLKVLANLNIAEHRFPQDGRIRLKLAGRAVDLRISTLPTQFGESVVLRILDQSAALLDLERLGLPAPIEASVREVIRRPNGIFIVTGPTGSGKTTTLYSCLKILNTPDVKILTVEDPVEYEIDGLLQVPVDHAAGLNFERALRTFLRQDPDIVMVGEIRDPDTARIAVQAALTGHLVLSTLHTNDAAGAITRLMDMGVEPFLLASSVEAVLAQRLVRCICPECKTGCSPPAAALRQAGLEGGVATGRRFYRGAGCTACEQTGYKGRIGIFELLSVGDELRELIATGVPLAQLRRAALRRGMTTLRDAGLHAVFKGETTLDEIVRYT